MLKNNSLSSLANTARGFVRHIKLLIGSLFNYVDNVVYQPHLAQMENEKIYAERVHRTRLSDEDIQHITKYMCEVWDLDYRRKYFADTPIHMTLQGQVIPLIERLLNADQSVRTVANIGVNYAFADHVMAERFPDVKFIGVDFQPDLAEVNSDFDEKNLQFVSGYALDLIESGKLVSDVYFMSSAATTITNPELRHYISIFAQKARYVVFNEPIFADPYGFYNNPDVLAADRSLPVYLQKIPSTLSKMQSHLCLIHNYKAMLEAAGFEIQYYSVA